LLSGLIAACGGASPSTPGAPSAVGFEGQWTGTTTQGWSIAVTVSAAQKVTAITVGYNVGGCTGTRQFSNLSIDIRPFTSPFGTRYENGFGHGADDGRNVTEIFGGFESNTAMGTMVYDYSGCGGGFTPGTRPDDDLA
jgi:hypothetical protein